MTQDNIYEEVARKLKLQKKDVKNAYVHFWKFIKEKIESFDLVNITEEEFKNTKTSFNIPRIGKFYTTYFDIQKAKKRYDKAKESKTSA